MQWQFQFCTQPTALAVAQFDIATGLCTLGPCLGDTLTAVPLTIQNNGEVHVASAPFLETFV